MNGSISMTGRGALQAQDILHVRRHIHTRKVEALGRKACGCYRLIRRLSQQIGRDRQDRPHPRRPAARLKASLSLTGPRDELTF